MENTHINTILHIKHLNAHDHLVQHNDLYIFSWSNSFIKRLNLEHQQLITTFFDGHRRHSV